MRYSIARSCDGDEFFSRERLRKLFAECIISFKDGWNFAASIRRNVETRRNSPLKISFHNLRDLFGKFSARQHKKIHMQKGKNWVKVELAFCRRMATSFFNFFYVEAYSFDTSVKNCCTKKLSALVYASQLLCEMDARWSDWAKFAEKSWLQHVEDFITRINWFTRWMESIAKGGKNSLTF